VAAADVAIVAENFSNQVSQRVEGSSTSTAYFEGGDVLTATWLAQFVAEYFEVLSVARRRILSCGFGSVESTPRKLQSFRAVQAPTSVNANEYI
jgi:hypothetical protein